MAYVGSPGHRSVTLRSFVLSFASITTPNSGCCVAKAPPIRVRSAVGSPRKISKYKTRIFFLVTSLDNGWNSILPSIYLLQKKLEYLGVINDHGEIKYLGAQEQEDV